MKYVCLTAKIYHYNNNLTQINFFLTYVYSMECHGPKPATHAGENPKTLCI